jgi:hypothetical protein
MFHAEKDIGQSPSPCGLDFLRNGYRSVNKERATVNQDSWDRMPASAPGEWFLWRGLSGSRSTTALELTFKIADVKRLQLRPDTCVMLRCDEG